MHPLSTNCIMRTQLLLAITNSPTCPSHRTSLWGDSRGPHCREEKRILPPKTPFRTLCIRNRHNGRATHTQNITPGCGGGGGGRGEVTSLLSRFPLDPNTPQIPILMPTPLTHNYNSRLSLASIFPPESFVILDVEKIQTYPGNQQE